MVDGGTLETVVDHVLAAPQDTSTDSFPMVVTPNVDILVGLDRSPHSVEADIFRRARFVLPDGAPIVAASRLLGSPLASRLTGSGLFELLWPRLVAEQRPVTVVCASSEIARRLAPEHPDASFVVPPFFDVGSRSELEAVIDQIEAGVQFGRTQFVLFGLGHPKDAVLADGLWQRRPHGCSQEPLFLGLGGSFAMYTGLKKRAPVTIQRLGLEWFYRFCQEPRRLFSRYFVRDLWFLVIVGREFRVGRSRIRPGS